MAGNDGVSLEAERWKKILTRMGHKVVFIAGELDGSGIVIPEMHFTYPEAYWVHEEIVDNHVAYKKVEREVYSLAGKIEGSLRVELNRIKPDVLVVANVFSLPIHFPLAVALERVITDLKIPTVARHHDFWWERKRYLKSSCFAFFKKFFPPTNPLIKHVTINSLTATELKKRCGIESVVIGDCFDFNNEKVYSNGFSARWRNDFGITKKDIVFLQATRIVPRKQIELSLELVSRLNNRRIVLVLAGRDGDESGNYIKKLEELAKQKGVRVKFIGCRVGAKREIIDGVQTYTLWDCFHNCDLTTYPSAVEGFGNQFIEAAFFRIPIFVNRYPVYKKDLEPLGFETIAINGRITNKTVKDVASVLTDKEKVRNITNKNFEIARKNFSFEAVEEKLKLLGF
ncbi:MAG: glycosyltransferase family 4 protein [Microgenomates group bacterium]